MEQKLLRQEKGCKIYADDVPVILQPIREKAIKFTNIGLVGYRVLQAPACVFAQIIQPNADPFSDVVIVTDAELIPFLVVRGWECCP
ncbi:hypothetical protein AB9X29_003785 [Vibrio vulnificus]